MCLAVSVSLSGCVSMCRSVRACVYLCVCLSDDTDVLQGSGSTFIDWQYPLAMGPVIVLGSKPYLGHNFDCIFNCSCHREVTSELVSQQHQRKSVQDQVIF